MAFNQKEYLNNYQKNNYQVYSFRVRKDNKKMIEKLNEIKNRNKYILDLIDNNSKKGILTIKEIKTLIKPIMNKRGINDIYLFGSYARGEANINSDVDIYCELGNVKTLYDSVDINNELKNALNKDVDLIFIGSTLEKVFEENMKQDLIKLC